MYKSILIIWAAHNTLQHTATHCNTLQHKEVSGPALQNTATHCNKMQHTATQYLTATIHISIQRQEHLDHVCTTATHCNTLQLTATHCNTRKFLSSTAQFCNTLHTATHCNTLQHPATHYLTATIHISIHRQEHLDHFQRALTRRPS